MPVRLAARNLSKSADVTDRSSKFICEWYVPHSSAQRPTYAPVLSMVTSNWLTTLPGNTSRLNSKAGTQNEWMTSCECSLNRIVSLVGTTSTGMYPLSPIVVTCWPDGSTFCEPSYVNCQFHLNAVMSTVRSGFLVILSTYVSVVSK